MNLIRTPDAGFHGLLLLRIQVNRDGAVTSVQVVEGPEELREAAGALAKTWRYEPFVRNGRTVPATFTDHVAVLPPELPVTRNVPFPEVRDWTSVKITLRRTACLGTCPAYAVQIDGTGDVLFDGVGGERRRHISRETLEGLLEVFRKANYFSLDREYRVEATDWPTCLTSISFDRQSMSVTDYGGLEVGMRRRFATWRRP